MEEQQTETLDLPKWDVALEGLINEEYKQQGRSLNLDDFTRLARDHAIRFDDILETVFAMTIQEKWRYCDEDGQYQPITQEDVNLLYVNRRLYEEDVRSYTGSWQPA